MSKESYYDQLEKKNNIVYYHLVSSQRKTLASR